MTQQICAICGGPLDTLGVLHALAGRGRRCTTCREAQAAEARLRAQAWRANNRDQHQEYARNWNQENPDRRRIIEERRYENRDRVSENARTAAYKRAHPAQRRESEGRRRAQKLKTQIGPVNLNAILQQYGLWCHICGKEISPADLHFDHVVPLSRGGAHVEKNIKPAHSACNYWKNDRLMEELPLRE